MEMEKDGHGAPGRHPHVHDHHHGSAHVSSFDAHGGSFDQFGSIAAGFTPGKAALGSMSGDNMPFVPRHTSFCVDGEHSAPQGASPPRPTTSNTQSFSSPSRPTTSQSNTVAAPALTSISGGSSNLVSRILGSGSDTFDSMALEGSDPAAGSDSVSNRSQGLRRNKHHGHHVSLAGD